MQGPLSSSALAVLDALVTAAQDRPTSGQASDAHLLPPEMLLAECLPQCDAQQMLERVLATAGSAAHTQQHATDGPSQWGHVTLLPFLGSDGHRNGVLS